MKTCTKNILSIFTVLFLVLLGAFAYAQNIDGDTESVKGKLHWENIAAFWVISVPVLYQTIQALKTLFNAYLYKKVEGKKDAAWYQALWMLLPALLGAGLGFLVEQSVYFVTPWGIGAGVLAGIFNTTLYGKIKSGIDNLKLKAPEGGAAVIFTNENNDPE